MIIKSLVQDVIVQQEFGTLKHKKLFAKEKSIGIW